MSAITSQPRPNEMYNIVPTNEGLNAGNNDASLEEQEENDEKNKRKVDNTDDIDSVIETCCCPEPCWIFELSNSCFECIASCIHTCCEDSSNDNIVDGSGGDNCDVGCVDCFSKCCDD